MTGDETSGGIRRVRLGAATGLAMTENLKAGSDGAVRGLWVHEHPNNPPKRVPSRVPGDRIFGRFFARRSKQCFLLGKGLRVVAPRCGICGKDLNVPGRGEAFQYVSPIAEPLAESGHDACSCLFIGTKALVATVSSQLTLLLEMSVAVFREKVVVAMIGPGKTNRHPILFCRSCGANLLTKINPPSQQHYGWDWLTELEPRSGPRSPVLQKLSKIGRFLLPIASE